MLEKYFDYVEHIGHTHHIDIVAIKDDIKYCMNVKSGKHYSVSPTNIKKFLETNSEDKTCLLFLDRENSYLFTLESILPPVYDINVSNAELKKAKLESMKNYNKYKSFKKTVYIYFTEYRSEKPSKCLKVHNRTIDEIEEKIIKSFS